MCLPAVIAGRHRQQSYSNHATVIDDDRKSVTEICECRESLQNCHFPPLCGLASKQRHPTEIAHLNTMRDKVPEKLAAE
jgi:hypothetical protein